MRVLVCGGRQFEDADMVRRQLSHLHERTPVTVLIHGSVTGVGAAAEAWARRNGAHVVRYPPNWELYGKKAEGRRNAFMLEDSRPHLVLAFPGGPHTADLIQRALAANIVVLVIPIDDCAGARVDLAGNAGHRHMIGNEEDADPVSRTDILRVRGVSQTFSDQKKPSSNGTSQTLLTLSDWVSGSVCRA